MSALTVASETVTFPGTEEIVTLDIASLSAIHWHVLVDGEDAGCFMDRWDAGIWVNDFLTLIEGAGPAQARAVRGPACWLASANS